MYKKCLLSFIFLFFLTTCSAPTKNFPEQEEKLKTIVQQKYQSDSEMFYNDDKSFALVVKQEKQSTKNPHPFLQFFIYELGENKIIFENSNERGTVRWKNNNQVEVIIVPGIIREGEDNFYGYIYDARTKSKIDLNSINKRN
jgi:hypothetical protein